jgi:hypothetical protein
MALAGIAFGVLVSEHAAGRFEDGFGDEAFARDQLNLVGSAAWFL